MTELVKHLDTLVGPKPVKKYGPTYKYNPKTRMYDILVKEDIEPWEVL